MAQQLSSIIRYVNHLLQLQLVVQELQHRCASNIQEHRREQSCWIMRVQEVPECHCCLRLNVVDELQCKVQVVPQPHSRQRLSELQEVSEVIHCCSVRGGQGAMLFNTGIANRS